MKIARAGFVLVIFSLLVQHIQAQLLDLSAAKIVCLTADKNFLLRTPVVLQEEIQKRTGIRLTVTNKKTSSGLAAIILIDANDLSGLSENQRKALASLPVIGTEGYRVAVMDADRTLLISGKDPRGLLYGVGYLLRKLEMRPGRVELKTDISVGSNPFYPLRGHQLGYRPKTNAYDAFTVAMFDQYIRDLALFGANSIEILPPRTDDIPTSQHMVLPPAKMIVEQSRICKEYGLDVWMWYPNVGKDYENPDSIQTELRERENVFSSLPRLNAVFVPGGDPGDLTPDVLFHWLEKEAVVLRKYHPEAKIWVSPQGFNTDQHWFDEFFAQVNKQYPWFGGVVFGPWVKIPIKRLRQLVNPSIPIRHYPDITHSLNCEYPVPHWDPAWAVTLGRECINPRPDDEKTIHEAVEKYCIGSISYSEGTNDDVNKFVWTGQDWNPGSPVMETLRDYARFFIGPDFTEAAAQGIAALENNMRGPAITNASVSLTLLQWQRMEQQASPALLRNPRFQMCLIRAYFDAYTRRRLIYETELEQEAKDVLLSAKPDQLNDAVKKAREILGLALSTPVLPDYKARCLALADSLYKSIGAQLTVKRHGGMQERGNFIDFIDFPLTDAPWLLEKLSAIEKAGTAEEKIKEIGKIIHRDDPGPGGFYDHFADPQSWHRIVPGKLSWAEDPGNLESPHTGFGTGVKGLSWLANPADPGSKGRIVPISWKNQAMTLYGVPLKIHYNGLDSHSDYRIRIVYTGRFKSRMKMMTESGYLVHDFIQTGVQPEYEFDLPRSAIKNGKVTFVWTCDGKDRGSQVTEMWLIKK
ncbi:MAG: hypothetical protein Q8939_15505 [Bacteroidota bacterium]|nr:hypothetical protein [Bacteroidota bacterium]